VAVIAAGTSDLPVSREAARTLEYYGETVSEFNDVGVAGLHRLLSRLADVRAHEVVIAVAGMDAALVSVLGGLVRAPLIAVPTSVGYGAARGGETALAASLASCAAGVVVVNIDNGFGAACAALRILNHGFQQIVLTSRPSGTFRSSQGSGAKRRFASSTP
jgi:NCAIR mutase (PurE)-related protein